MIAVPGNPIEHIDALVHRAAAAAVQGAEAGL